MLPMNFVWRAGRIEPREDYRISVRDQVFEHGLGLFETLRTWSGQATLLPRHLERLARSADALGLAVADTRLPDESAISDLIQAEGIVGDARLRITLTAGPPAQLWMSAAPLSEPPGFVVATAKIGDAPWSIAFDEPLHRHKTLNYWSRRRMFEDARARDLDECLVHTSDGRVWEGTRMNLFLVRGNALLTPGLEGPVLPGVFRQLVIERAQTLGIRVHQQDLTTADLDVADEVLLTNSVRGIVAGRWVRGRELPAPGPIARVLWTYLKTWLCQPDGVTPP